MPSIHWNGANGKLMSFSVIIESFQLMKHRALGDFPCGCRILKLVKALDLILLVFGPVLARPRLLLALPLAPVMSKASGYHHQSSNSGSVSASLAERLALTMVCTKPANAGAFLVLGPQSDPLHPHWLDFPVSGLRARGV